MSYRRPSAPRTSVQSTFRTTSRGTGYQKNYVSQQSGAKRHQFTADVPCGSVPPALLAGEYAIVPLLKFKRSATGVVDDVPLAPTASNNYQTSNVFNGGKIVNFHATVRIKNRAAIGGYLDVYQVALSFYDALVWDTLFPTACPVQIDTTTVGPADLRGQVTTKAMTTTLIVENTINNYKFLQHYIKKMGTIFITNEDGGNGGEVTINIDKVPAKCRRSQTGMFWGLFLHNNSDKNGAETLTLDCTVEESFDEIPSDNRLPFID